MDLTAKIAANLRAFQIAVNAHDRENPEPHPAAYGIGISAHDMARLGFDEGETVLPGITISTDQGVSGNFRVYCGAEHDGPQRSSVTSTDAISRTPVGSGT